MVGGNGGNQFRQYGGQNVGNQKGIMQNRKCRALGMILMRIEEVNSKLHFVANFQRASTSDIFNMFYLKEQYTELLAPIPEPHQVPQNDSNIISEVSSVEQGGGIHYKTQVPTPQESKVMKNDNVIAPGMFRINPSKTSRKDKFVPINKVRASIRTNPITVSQSHVITKKIVKSDSNGLLFNRSKTITSAKNRRPQPREQYNE
ncbi:hypothetical protein Tco_0152046 [Tanacetum coccineum]